jgi:hypothetical protein
MTCPVSALSAYMKPSSIPVPRYATPSTTAGDEAPASMFRLRHSISPVAAFSA